MEYRLAHMQDEAAIIELWCRVFGDAPKDIRCWLWEFAGLGHVYVAASQGEIKAHLLAVPCNVEEHRGVYLFALATDADSRGQGIMSGLMRYAESMEKQGGAVFCVLIPADNNLYAYYERQGYSSTVWLRNIQVDRPLQTPAAIDFAPFDGADLAKLRQTFCDVPYVSFDASRYGLILEDIYAEGMLAACCEGGYAVFGRLSNGETVVAELFACNEAVANSLLAAVMLKLGCTVTRLTLAKASSLFVGQGSDVPAALVKALDASFIGETNKNLYMRFGFDDLSFIAKA